MALYNGLTLLFHFDEFFFFFHFPLLERKDRKDRNYVLFIRILPGMDIYILWFSAGCGYRCEQDPVSALQDLAEM